MSQEKKRTRHKGLECDDNNCQVYYPVIIRSIILKIMVVVAASELTNHHVAFYFYYLRWPINCSTAPTVFHSSS